MRNKEVKHAAENYNTIVAGLYRAGRVVHAKRIRDEMNPCRINLDLNSYMDELNYMLHHRMMK